MEASAAPVPARFDAHGSPNGTQQAASGGERERVFEPVDLPDPHKLSGATIATFAAFAGVAAIALGSWAFVSSVRSDDPVEVVRPVPIYGAAQAISLLSKPSTERIPLKGSRGSVILAVRGGGRGLLVLDGLGIAPVGMSYQAWVVVNPRKRPLEHESAAVFSGVETIVPLSTPVPPGSVLGITVEQAGGVSAPTKAFRLGAQRVVPARD